jgi:putative inorganic carbon (HCO3(-)) transporter
MIIAEKQFLERWVLFWTLGFLLATTFSSALMEISFGAAFVGWLLLRVKNPTAFPFERKLFIALLGYVLLSCISFSWSEFPKQSFRGILKVLQQVALFWVVADTLATAERQQTSFRFLTMIFLFVGINGIWQYLTGADFVRRFPVEAATAGPRISASFKNYGLLSSFVISFLPLIFGRLDRWASHGDKMTGILGTGLGLLLLYWTRARAAWVSFFGGLIFFLMILRKKVLVLVVGVAAVVGVVVLPQSMVIHLDAEGKEQSIVERFALWDRALQVIKARPLTGTGINTYAVAHQKYDTTQSWRVKNYYAHNGYLQMAAETGLPTLAFFLAFLVFYFLKAFRTFKSLPEGIERNTLAGILTGVVNFLILGLGDTKFHNPHAILAFWFLMGWGIAYQNQASKSAVQ